MATAPEKGSTAPRGLVALWNFLVKYLPAIIVLVGGTWQVATYFVARHDQAAAEAGRRLLEAQKPYFEKQFALYAEAAKVTGLLMTLPLPAADAIDTLSNVEDWAWARRRFWQLFWNELPIVEDHDVASAMGAFKTVLDPIEACIRSGSPTSDCKKLQDRLPASSKALADAISLSIRQTWRYDLPPPGPPSPGG